MDLGAYVQIEDLDKIAEENGIEVPRLRGYRLMKDEEPVDIEAHITDRNLEVECCRSLCECYWKEDANWCELSDETRTLCKKYIANFDKYYEDHSKLTVNWDLLTPEQTDILKRRIQEETRCITEQFEVWNKYAGKPGILYIHARIGGGNWEYYNGPELTKQPWFLERVDDGYDSTYCDIYAKISE